MTMRSPQSFAGCPQRIADSCPTKCHFDLKCSIKSQLINLFDYVGAFCYNNRIIMKGQPNLTMPHAQTPHPFLKRLKNLTQPAHQQLEANLYAQRMVAGTISQADYAAYLQRLWPIHVTVEAEYQRWPDWAAYGFDITSRQRAPLLAQDLAYLAYPLPADSHFPLSPGHDFAEMLAYLYVLEGSTLGGQVLLRKIKPVLGLTPQQGGAYFYSYGPQVGSQWQAVQQFLTDYVTQKPTAETVIINQANQFFEMIDQWLTAKPL